MDESIAKNLKGMPSGYKIFVTKNKHVQKYILSLVKDQNIVIIENETFSSEAPVVIMHQGKEILAKTDTSYERNIILASETIETINDFIVSCNQKAVSEGYLLFACEYNGFNYSNNVNIINDIKFADMVSMESIKDIVISDIDRYMNNIHKYRKMGCNHGINYILHGNPGLGKTSFCKALASHYHANLFKIKSSDNLNPIQQGLCIVMVDD